MLEATAHADRAEDVVAEAFAVQPINQILPADDVAVGEGSIRLEEGGGPERSQSCLRRLRDAAVGSGLPTDAIQHDSLAVKAIEGAKAEVAMADHIVDFDASFENALHQCTGGGDLINRVVIKVQAVSNRLTHEVRDAVSGPFGLLLKRTPEPFANGKLKGMTAAWVAVLSHVVMING